MIRRSGPWLFSFGNHFRTSCRSQLPVRSWGAENEERKRLEADDDVPRALAGSFVNQAGDEAGAEAIAVSGFPYGEQPGAGDNALLGMAFGEEVEGHSFGVPAQAGFLVELVGGSEAAQAVHLVAHLRGDR